MMYGCIYQEQNDEQSLGRVNAVNDTKAFNECKTKWCN